MRSQLLQKPLALLLSVSLVLGSVPLQAVAEELVPAEEDPTTIEVPLLSDEGAEQTGVVVEEVGEPDADEAAPADEGDSEETATVDEQLAAPEDLPEDLPEDDALAAQGTGLEWTDTTCDVKYTYDTSFDGYGTETVTITRIDVMSEQPKASLDLVIPSVIDGKSVTALGRFNNSGPLFLNNRNNIAICSVSIPSSVRVLNEYALEDPSPNSERKLNIKQVTFEEGVSITEIPRGCFYQLPLESITLPEGVTTIKEYAFFSCDELATITLPSTLETIEGFAFRYCDALTSLVVPEGVTSIGQCAFEPPHGQGEPNGNFTYDFSGGTSLKSVTLPNSLETIGDRAFYANTALTTVTIGTSMADAHLQTIGDYAFAASSLTGIEIPDSVTTIGTSAFDWEPYREGLNYLYSFKREGEHTLATVELGSSQEASQLRTIGLNAFRDGIFTSIAIPNTLESLGYVASASGSWESPFNGCTELQTIAWPTVQTANSFTAVGGFHDCYKLSDDNVINSLPSWIDTIDVAAFLNNAFTDIVIPDTVTTIGAYAFRQDLYDDEHENQGMNSVVIGSSVTSIGENAFDSNKLTALTIKDGTAPLVIDDYAFAYNHTLDGATIVLPSRVTYLGASVFFDVGTNMYVSGDERDYEAHNSYYLYNKDIRFKCYDEAFVDDSPWDPWDGSSDETSVVYYPQDAVADSEVMRLKERYDTSWGSSMRWEPFDPADTTIRHTISGTVPAGATVMLEVDYQATLPELTDKGDAQSFSVKVAEGSDVLLHVFLDDYAEYVVSPAGTTAPSPLTASWGPTVTADDMTPLSTTGTLQVKLAGDHAANANVAIVDASGSIVRQGYAARALVYIAEELPAGAYTVVAYADNDSFSRLSSLADFERMGLGSSSYAKADVEVPARGIAQITLTPPALDTAQLTGVLESGDVYIPISSTVPGIVFSAQIRFAMADGRTADKLYVSLPEGIEPVLASSVAKKYGVGGYDAQTHTLTLTDLAETDRSGSLISVGLRASNAAAGNQAVSVSLVTGNVTVPVGSAPIEVNALSIDVPQGTLGSATFDVTVYAAPEATVKFAVGSTSLDTTCKTNKVGRGTATLTIPEDELSIYAPSYTVTATLADDGQISTSNRVYYQHTDGSDVVTPTVHDFYFVHAQEQVDLAKDGKDCTGGSYTVVAVPSAHPDLYSPTWPFTASIDSAMPLGDTMTLALGMLDDSMRYETMALVGTKDLGNGAKRYTYRADVAIGDGNIEHSLSNHDVPVRFDVVPQVNDGAELPALSQETYDYLKRQAVDRAGQKAEMPDNIKSLFTQISAEEWAGYFNNGWRHENWSHDSEAWKAYNQLSPELQARFDQLEDRLSDLYDTLAVVLGNRKAIFAYGSLQEYFADNYGYQGGQIASASALEQAGYRMFYDLDTASVPEAVTPTSAGEMTTPEWVGALYATYTPEELVALADDEELETQDASSGGKTLTFRDSNGNLHQIQLPANVGEATKLPGVSAEDILSNGLDSLYKDLENYKDDTQYMDAQTVHAVHTALAGGMDNTMGTINTIKSNFMLLWTARNAFNKDEFIDRCNELKRLNMMDEYYQNNNPGSICQRAIRQERIFLCNYLNDLLQMAPMNGADIAVNTVTTGVGDAALCMGRPEVATLNAVASTTWTVGANLTLTELTRRANYDRYVLQKYRAYRESVCRHDAFGKLHYKKAAKMDPSGYVYEGADEARVADVMATIYYQRSDGEWVPWDEAAEYDEVNPQLTGAGGLFAWDVPTGTWRALFQKEGYDDAWSDEMEVLPEWTNVGINLLRSGAPAVDETDTVVDAAYDHMDVAFNQFMLTDDAVAPTATVNGTKVQASWQQSVAGRDAYGHDVQLSRTLRVPLAAYAQPGAELTVVVSGAKSYTGKAMEQPYTKKVIVPTTAYFSVWRTKGGSYTVSYEGFERTFDSSTNQAVPWGTKVTLTAVPDAGYAVKGWYEANRDYQGNPREPYYFEDKLVTSERVFRFAAGAGTVDGVEVFDDAVPYLCAVFSRQFIDVFDSTPHADDIQWLADHGISEGWTVAEGTFEFRPGKQVVRQDMAAFLYRLAGSPAYVPSAADKAMFADVSEQTPHHTEIWWLASTGISRGWNEKNGTKTFRGTSTVKRQDMAAFLRRLAEWSGADVSMPAGATNIFSDVVTTGPEANRTSHYDDIVWLATTGVTKGWTMGDGTIQFRGMNNVVRQDMAAFLQRLDTYIVEHPAV